MCNGFTGVIAEIGNFEFFCCVSSADEIFVEKFRCLCSRSYDMGGRGTPSPVLIKTFLLIVSIPFASACIN